MSLCFFKHISENELYIGGDSRACSFQEDGTSYVANDNTTKLHTIGNDTLIFGSGFSFVIENTLNDYKQLKDKNAWNLSLLAKKYTNLFMANNPMLPPHKSADGLLTAFLMVQAVDGAIEKHIICNSAYDYKPIKAAYGQSETGAIGCYTEEGNNKFHELTKDVTDPVKILAIFEEIYNLHNSCEVGGILTVYRFTGEGIKDRYHYPIIDKEVYPKLPNELQSVYNLKGINIINDSGVSTFSIDKNGDVISSGNITMTGGSISWSNVNTDPVATSAASTANSAASAASTAASNIKKLADGTYSGGTFIDGNVIASPNIVGGKILGGEFMDLSEKYKLVLNYNSNGAGALNIVNTSSGEVVFTIYNGDFGYTSISGKQGQTIFTFDASTNTIDFGNNTVKGVTAVFA